MSNPIVFRPNQNLKLNQELEVFETLMSFYDEAHDGNTKVTLDLSDIESEPLVTLAKAFQRVAMNWSRDMGNVFAMTAYSPNTGELAKQYVRDAIQGIFDIIHIPDTKAEARSSNMEPVS